MTLIVLLLVGLAFSAPLPETEGQSSPSNDRSVLLDAASEAKSFPILQTVSLTSYGESDVNNRKESRSRLQTNPLDEIDDLVPVSITSPTMFRHSGRTFSQVPLPSSDKTYTDSAKEITGKNQDNQRNDPELLNAEDPEYKRKDFHVTSEVRTVQFQIVKKSRQASFLPPLVFAQHPPGMNLEPTEVEAPGTTPTTLSMVTDDLPLTTHAIFSIPILAANQSFQIYKRHNSKKDKFPVIHRNLEMRTPDELPQQDDPGRLILESYPTQSVSGILKENVPSKLIQDSPVIYIQNFSASKTSNGEIDSEAKTHEDLVGDVAKDSSSNQQKDVESERMSSGMLIDEPTSRSSMPVAFRNENGSNVNKSRFYEATSMVVSKMLPIDDQLCNHSLINIKCISENSSLNLSLVTSSLNNKLLSTRDILLNVSDATEAKDPVTETGPDLVNVKNEAKDSLFMDRTASQKNEAKGTSNVEIREANDESYFRSLGSSENREFRIFIDNDDKDSDRTPPPMDSATQQYNEQLRMKVYTASSEISYRNFNPEANISTILEPEIPLASTHYLNESRKDQSSVVSEVRKQDHLENRKPLVEPHIYDEENSESVDDSDTERRDNDGQFGSAGFPTTEVPIADSSLDREATVKSIRVNVSSASLSEGALPPSGRIIKTPQKADFHLLPQASDSDAEDAFPLGIYPQKPSLSPPMQQERVSIPVSEAINKSMSPAGVAGIVMGVLVSVFVIAGAAGFYYYHRQTDIRPKVLSSDRSCANSDSGGYLDDQCRVAYVNSQGTPEDLVSLDNDSFLNSLESMTIQNLWTDNIRHTKL